MGVALPKGGAFLRLCIGGIIPALNAFKQE